MRAMQAMMVGSCMAVMMGCGAESNGRGRAETPPSGGTGAAPASLLGSQGMALDAPPPPEASASSDSSGRADSHWQTPEPAPRERPGLGTEWGEARESHIRDVSFFRNEPERPFATTTLFYNDLPGVERLAAWHGGTPHFHDVRPLQGAAITVSVRGASGEPLEAMQVGDRTYVVGEQGERYSVVISNHTPRRFEAVATVDGLDVISGQVGALDNRGYVLMPHADLEIDGFRRSEDEVAAFRFAPVRDSYVAARGEARNVGVIGIAFFAERGDDWDSDEMETRDSASPFPNQGRFAAPPPGF